MIPPLLITTSAPNLEKSIEKGGTLSGRLNTDDGVNHLVDSLAKGLPFEDAHTFAKGCGDLIPAATDTDVKKKKTKKSVDDALDDIQKSFKREVPPKAGAKVHKPIKDAEQKREEAAERVEKSSPGEGSRGGKIVGHTRSGKPIYGHITHASQMQDRANGYNKHDHEDAAKHFKEAYEAKEREHARAHGTGLHAAYHVGKKEMRAKDKLDKNRIHHDGKARDAPIVWKSEFPLTANGVSKALAFIIDPSRDIKDPLLANTHGEEFHSDVDKETVDFLTRTGSVNPDDPVHNPPVTPELNGFPLAIPMFYCSLPESDLIKGGKSLIQKAFKW